MIVDPKGPLAKRWRGRPGAIVADGSPVTGPLVSEIRTIQVSNLGAATNTSALDKWLPRSEAPGNGVFPAHWVAGER